MKYRNADLGSIAEAKQRLDAGEVFWFNSMFRDDSDITKICYNGALALIGMSPYRFGSVPCNGIWDRFSEWETEVNWYDSVHQSAGVICWVYDSDKRQRLTIVDGYNSSKRFPFKTEGGTWYTYATPATVDSIKQFLLKD